jgi:hypothetical protein
VWAALTQKNLLLRMLWSVLLGAMIWLSLIFWWHLSASLHLGGWNWMAVGVNTSTVVFLGSILLIGVVSTQIPLWGMRWFFRWRIVNSETPTIADSMQFSLRRLFYGTFLVAVFFVGRPSDSAS